MRFEDKSEVNGEIKLWLYKQGKLIQKEELKNLVVDSGRERIAQLLGGKTTLTIGYLGVGEGDSVADETDTQLTNQQLIPLRGWDGESVQVEGKDVIHQFWIKSDECNNLNIKEFGLFTKDNVLFSRRVRDGAIFKEDDIEIKGTWTIHF